MTGEGPTLIPSIPHAELGMRWSGAGRRGLPSIRGSRRRRRGGGPGTTLRGSAPAQETWPHQRSGQHKREAWADMRSREYERGAGSAPRSRKHQGNAWANAVHGEGLDEDLWTRPRGRPDRSPRRVAGRVAAVLLWLLVFSSAGSGVLALARVRAMHGVPPAAATPPAGLEGFAELSVAAFLEGSDAAVRGFFDGVSPAPGPDLGHPGERFVARAAAVGVSPAGDAWRVTVGAEVLVAADGGYRRDGIHWFEVSVTRNAGGYVATSLPNEVLGPAVVSGR